MTVAAAHGRHFRLNGWGIHIFDVLLEPTGSLNEYRLFDEIVEIDSRFGHHIGEHVFFETISDPSLRLMHLEIGARTAAILYAEGILTEDHFLAADEDEHHIFMPEVAFPHGSTAPLVIFSQFRWEQRGNQDEVASRWIDRVA